MPIYEYVCQKCGKPFEELVRGKEAVKCPKCGSQQVERKLSTFATRGGGGNTGPAGSCAAGGLPFS